MNMNMKQVNENKIYTTINEYKKMIKNGQKINEENEIDTNFEEDFAKAQDTFDDVVELIKETYFNGENINLKLTLNKRSSINTGKWVMEIESNDIINTAHSFVQHFLTSLKIRTVWGSKNDDGNYIFGLHVEYSHPGGGGNGTKLSPEYLYFNPQNLTWWIDDK